MFVQNPDPFLLPSYRISPFRTSHISLNHNLPEDNSIETYFEERFSGCDFQYHTTGRSAIYSALSFYKLQKTDLVTILTTSNNFYISGCVTQEIEKFCRWNREITPETKLIFVNHEFGYIYPEMDYIVSLGLPVIEDCCTTFFSQNKQGMVGKYGDFAVYSFPKFFPIQIGGLLVNNRNLSLPFSSSLQPEARQYIQKVVSYYINQKDSLLRKRKAIYNYGITQFKTLGFTERFKRDPSTVPSVMLLNNNGIINDLPALKMHLQNHGIQSSVFYGEDAFFIPNHQSLNEEDIQYFFSVITHFIKHQKDDHI